MGDAVSCSIRHSTQGSVLYTGPLEPDVETKSLTAAGRLWYNRSIDKVVLDKAEITYMDGTTETLLGSSISCEPSLSSQISWARILGFFIVLIIIVLSNLWIWGDFL